MFNLSEDNDEQNISIYTGQSHASLPVRFDPLFTALGCDSEQSSTPLNVEDAGITMWALQTVTPGNGRGCSDMAPEETDDG